jgi:uncharacterized membrane protein HdeD (DUF308 family)
MRKAAGIMLMVSGVYVLVNSVVLIIASLSFARSAGNPVILLIVQISNMFLMFCGAFVVIGGVFCVKRRDWGLCLASGLIAVLIGIYPVVKEPVPGSYLLAELPVNWGMWLLVSGAVLSMIFIITRKKEWSEILD